MKTKNLKKISLLGIVVASLLMLSNAISAEQFGSFEYVIENDEVLITSFLDNEATEVEIPAEIEGYPVTLLEQAFQGCTNIESVTLPDSITSIGYNTFTSCKNLAYITIPDSVTYIGSYAFAGCESLESITLPDNLGTIEYYAFADCISLTEINIPEGVTYIGWSSFENCSSLKKIVIPDSVTCIDEGIFAGCGSLEHISIPFIGYERSLPRRFVFLFGRDSMPYPDFYQVDYRPNDNYGSYIESYYLPSSLKSVTVTDADIIPEFTFEDCRSITDFDINDDAVIYPDAFSYTGAYLDKSNWDGGSVGKGALYIDNILLESDGSIRGSYKVKDGTVTIATYALANNARLTEVTIPNSVQYIGYGIFSNCTNLETLNIPFVGESRNAKSSPRAVLSHHFSGDRLTEDYYETNQPYSSSSYDGMSVFMPISLKNVNITDANQIPYGAFSGCSSLEKISINQGVKTIGAKAFINCDNLDELRIYSNNAKFATSNMFENTELVTVYCHKGSTAERYAEKYAYVEYFDREYMNTLVAKSNIVGENIVLCMEFEGEIYDKEVICAFYDKDDRMVKAVSVPVEWKADKIYITTPDEPTITTAKIMARTSLTSPEPASQVAAVSVR